MSKETEILDIRPTEEKGKASAPTAVAWQGKKGKLIENATKDASLEKFAANEENIAVVLKSLKFDGMFTDSDALNKTVLASLSQYVMMPGKGKLRAKVSKVYLTFAKAKVNNDLRRFCLDQLRWCGSKAQAKAVQKIAESDKCKAICDFAKMVAKELAGDVY